MVEQAQAAEPRRDAAGTKAVSLTLTRPRRTQDNEAGYRRGGLGDGWRRELARHRDKSSRPLLHVGPVLQHRVGSRGALENDNKLQLCAITLTNHKPARLNRLTKAMATAFMIMRCRYSSSLSGHSYFERS